MSDGQAAGRTTAHRLEWGAVVVLALLRVAWVLIDAPIHSVDTLRYRNPEDPLSTLRFDLGQGPGQLLQLLYLLPVELAAAIQGFATGLLWGWASIVACRGLPRPVFWFALALSMSPWWLVWDGRLLTESLTLSACALFAAGVVRWTMGDASSPMIAGAAVALLVRPLVAPLVAAILLLAVASRRAAPKPRWAGAALAVLAAFGLVQTAAFNSAPVSYPYLPAPTTMEAVRAADRYVGRFHIDGYLELARQHGMPECPAALTIPPRMEGLTPLWTQTCPEMVEWLEAGGLPWHAEIMGNMSATLREMAVGEWHAETWGFVAQSDPRWVKVLHRLLDWWWPVVRAVDVVMWAVLGVATVWLLRPGTRWFFRAGFAVCAIGFAAALWLVDGIEMWRHILPATAVVIPASIATTRGGP